MSETPHIPFNTSANPRTEDLAKNTLYQTKNNTNKRKVQRKKVVVVVVATTITTVVLYLEGIIPKVHYKETMVKLTEICPNQDVINDRKLIENYSK